MSGKVGIISEYNPFHFGHLYHLNQSILMSSADLKIAIISGNFVQRGEPSLVNKWEKAKCALSFGFDLVVELPTLYAISSAENFANGAVKIANLLECEYLSFGTEIGDIATLKDLSDLISLNDSKYMETVRKNISFGFSYPKSQQLAIEELFGNKYKDICCPNNILGLEYLKSISSLNSNIKPITVARNFEMSSSSDIRSCIRLKNDINSFKEILPEFSFNIIKENILNGHIVYSLKSFEKEIIYALRRISLDNLKNVPDIPDNMFNLIKKAANSCNTLLELISILKNKSITQARIQRILLYILLGITKDDIKMSKTVLPYVRVLGMNNNGKNIVSSLSDKVCFVTSVKDFENSCTNVNLLRMLEIDKFASDVYSLAYTNDSRGNLDYITRIITM